MENSYLVAICIPSYNHPDYLVRLLTSIQLQTYSRYVICITDNTRSDCLEKIVKEYADPRIIYIHNEENVGAVNNVNRCIKLALNQDVDLIKIMFQDDWFTQKESLARMVEKLAYESADVVFSANYEVYSSGEIVYRKAAKNFLSEQSKDLSAIYRTNQLGAPSNLLYRAEDIYFDINYTWLMDVDFYLRLLNNKRMVYDTRPNICIGHDGDQLSDYYYRKPFKVLKETCGLYNKYNWLHNNKNRKYIIFTAASVFWKLGKKYINIFKSFIIK